MTPDLVRVCGRCGHDLDDYEEELGGTTTGCCFCNGALVTVQICKLCASGAGGECHTPGCALWMNRAPDLPVGFVLREGHNDQ